MSGEVADPALGVCRRPEASQQHRAERFPRVPRPRSRASSCSTDSGGRTALGELVVAAGQAPPVLRPVEEPLHDVIERDQLCRVCGRYAEYPALHHIVFESRTAWCCRATSSRSAGSPDRPATVGSRTARKRGCGGRSPRHRGTPGHRRRLSPRVRSGAPSPGSGPLFLDSSLHRDGERRSPGGRAGDQLPSPSIKRLSLVPQSWSCQWCSVTWPPLMVTCGGPCASGVASW